MIFVYEIALVVILSNNPGYHSFIVHQFSTWGECKVKEAALRRDGVIDKREFTADCRRNVRIYFGDMP